ncbi:MAG: type II secretion system protein [Planctomycetes bacterium]|nr:type II secretion system protein [Planctomycetota bacterium]
MQRTCHQSGFTLLELSVVVGVMLTLATVGMTGLSSSLRDSSVDGASQGIEQAADFARRLAMNPWGKAIDTASRHDELKRYGVVLVDAQSGAPAYVAVTYGSAATVANILLGSDGKPVFQRAFNRNVAFYSGPAGSAPPRLGTDLGWMYHYDTGMTASGCARTLRPVCVGITAARVAASRLDPVTTVRITDQLAAGTLDGRLRLAIEVQPTGMMTTGAWRP